MTATGRPATRVEALPIAPDGTFPNNPRLPLLVYRAAVAITGTDPAAAFEELFARQGWPDGWRNGIFAHHHYHSTAHEVLGVFRGSAEVQMGGPAGPVLALQPGDVVIVPAGVAHKRIAARGRLGVVGAYPRGQSPDLCRDASGARNVAAVPIPALDPVFGAQGPLHEHWREGGPAGTG